MVFENKNILKLTGLTVSFVVNDWLSQLDNKSTLRDLHFDPKDVVVTIYNRYNWSGQKAFPTIFINNN